MDVTKEQAPTAEEIRFASCMKELFACADDVAKAGDYIGQFPNSWAIWQAAIASKQAELESWQIVAENWRGSAVGWGRKNDALVAELDAANAKIAEADKHNLVLEATDYMHAVSVLFTPQPEGDVLAERKPSKDVKAYNAFIYLSTQGKRLRDAIDGTISITSQRELELLAVIEQMREALNKANVIIEQVNVPRHDINLLLCDIRKALALTPDMTALREFVAEKSANGIEWKFANTVERMPIGTRLYAITPRGFDSPSPNPEN